MDKVVELSAAEDRLLAGGKGAALAKMVNDGFNIPDGFVITTGVKAMDSLLEEEILSAFDKLGAKKVAVRSSAVAEDGAQDAWAGQMDTFLNIDRKGLIEAVEKCWKSSNSSRAKAYAKEKGLEAGRLAVVVQKMIDGDVSGVAFSLNPVASDDNQMVIEAVRGLADSLVSGEATPDNYAIDRRGRTISQTLQQPEPLLSQKQLSELSETLVKLEEYFGFPVDVEWTFKAGELFILQSRPITALG